LLELAGGVYHRNKAAACGGDAGVGEFWRSSSFSGCPAAATRPALLVQPTQASPERHSFGPF